jgi:hypothetical protein
MSDTWTEVAGKIDWSVFDQYPENTCTCLCKHVFRSHSKFIVSPQVGLVSRRSCPSCGSHKLTKASSDPEKMTL